MNANAALVGGAALECFGGDLDSHADTAPASLLQIFELRAWARARLFAEGMLDLRDAVDELAEAAERNGIPVDAAQAIMSEAFKAVRC